jgi:phosphoglycolate phosphatase-like HAD superfamily hydrolase
VTIRCAVFDFDGTLVDSNEIKRRLFFEVGSDFDPEGEVVRSVLDLATGDRHQICRAMAETLIAHGQCSSNQPEELAKRFVEEYTRDCKREVVACAEIAGATAALETLAANELPLFVNSATPLDALLPILRDRSLDRFFAGVYGRPRSKLENLGAIAERAESKPKEVVLVGDGEDDRQTALDFGCHFIGVVAPGPRRFRADPSCTVPDLSRLPEIIRGLEGSPP